MPTAQFQSFQEKSDPSQGPKRLADLRQELRRQGLDGFVVPRTDEYQGEYVPRCAERLAWLTGFTGSWGVAVALLGEAAIFVDGRYTMQAREQTDTNAFAQEHLVDNPPERWLAQRLRPGMKLGYDPALHTPDSVKRLEKVCTRAGATLVAVEQNPIDAVWADRPPPPAAPVVPQPEDLAGESTASKLQRLRVQLAEAGVDALAVTDPHAVAWLYNIRGGDVSHTPLPLARALVPREGAPTLFIDAAKLSNAMRDTLAGIGPIEAPAALERHLADLGAAKKRVRFDQGSASQKVVLALEGAGGTPDIGPDPITLLKAVKNAAEIAGARAAHRRDAAALAQFLHWLQREAPTGRVTEIEAAEQLEAFRRATGALRDVSFPTISAAGPNAALPHYRVSDRSNRHLEPGIYLVDSGAQYQDGTTDITRTVAVGTPDAEMRDRFTRVLRGHIAVATATFPKGSSGAQLDSFARRPLWDVGLDFDHGTGHGIGSYLSVHEGPQRISKLGTAPLEPGMIISNEPGYYKPGAWGIRIENLVLVEKRAMPGAEREMLGFETLSFTPIDLALVEPALMTPAEIAWLDAYHRQVRERVSPDVDADVRRWLEEATRPLGG